MSNKNLRSYRIQFICEVGEMQFNVKFPCQVKMMWARSNESAETTLVDVQNGIVNFNQTIKLYANMHLDTTTNKFVDKKCKFSFLIVTGKGEKSAGNFTYDLAEFFNNRVYELQKQFVLEKCPLPDTKIHLKIYYQQSTETGYDSMSRISTSSQLDISTTSVDTANFNQHTDHSEQSKSKKSESDTTTKEISQKQEENQNYDLLNESDLGGNLEHKGHEGDDKSQKIGENIQALNKITGKINDFVARCSGNIKNQIDNLKLKNKSLEESITVLKIQKEKAVKDNEENTSLVDTLRKQLNESKIDFQLKSKKESEKVSEMTQKYEQSQKLCSQLEKNMSQKGESQSSYIGELKTSFEETENNYKERLQTLNNELAEEKKEKNDLFNKVGKLQSTVNDLKQKLLEAQEKNSAFENRESQRERELTDLRYKIENVYEEIVKNLGNIIQ